VALDEVCNLRTIPHKTCQSQNTELEAIFSSYSDVNNQLEYVPKEIITKPNPPENVELAIQ
jgi:hypothetical protein